MIYTLLLGFHHTNLTLNCFCKLRTSVAHLIIIKAVGEKNMFRHRPGRIFPRIGGGLKGGNETIEKEKERRRKGEE